MQRSAFDDGFMARVFAHLRKFAQFSDPEIALYMKKRAGAMMHESRL